MGTINLLYKRDYAVTDKIRIVIPTVGEILDDEDTYYNTVALLTAMPIDLMVELDAAEIDFTSLDEYELFIIMFASIREMDTSLIFKDLDLKKFTIKENEERRSLYLYDETNDITIDRMTHNKITTALRFIHHLEKNHRRPANEEAKKYMLERAKIKANRRKNKQDYSDLESLIVAMVNTEQFKYDLDGTRRLTIYQFNECVQQVIKKVDYEHKMHGVYAGTIDPKGLSQNELNWLTHKK